MGFALIITMMIAISGVISGFSAEIFGLTRKVGDSPSIFIQTKNPNEGLSPEILAMIDHTNIKHVLPFSEKKVLFSSINGSFLSFLVGVNISKLMNYYSIADIYAGRSPQSNNNITECLVGKDIHHLIGSSEINFTDDSIKTEYQLHIVGLIQNVKEFQNTILIALKDYKMIFNKILTQNLYQGVKISLKNGRFVQETISDLKVVLKDYVQNLAIKPGQQTDIFTKSLFSDIINQLGLLFGVLFIIALIRIFHTTSWFVRKYERDLLIMRAMGLSNMQIISLIVLLAEIIGNIGFIMGLFFGFLIPSLIFTLLSIFFSGGFIIPEFDITTIILLLFFSNLVSVVAALYPAIIISQKKPSTLSLSTHGLDR